MRTDSEVAHAWDENAELWVRHVRAGWDKLRETFNNPRFLAFAPDLTDRKVIDLGCGEGRNSREFARRGAHVAAIDVSSKMIEAAQAAEAAQPLGISYRVASFSRLDGCADGSFDLALSTMALMDGPDFAGAAREAHRVLRPGGRVLFQRAASLLRDAAPEMGPQRPGRRDRLRGRRLFHRRGARRSLAVQGGAGGRRCVVRGPALPAPDGNVYQLSARSWLPHHQDAGAAADGRDGGRLPAPRTLSPPDSHLHLFFAAEKTGSDA